MSANPEDSEAVESIRLALQTLISDLDAVWPRSIAAIYLEQGLDALTQTRRAAASDTNPQ